MSLQKTKLVLATACALVSGLTVAAATNPLDSDGYITNWTGPIIPEFNGTSVANLLPITLPTLQSFISGAVTQNAVCSAIKDAVLSAGPSVVISFDGCSIPSSPPELRGKKLGPNELGLKVIVDDVSFSFTPIKPLNPRSTSP